MISIFESPSYTLNQYSEYVNLAKYYLNATTTSVPIRYFNIDIENSNYDENLLTTFNQFKNNLTGIYYNIYEFTPAFYTSPMVYTTMFEMDKDGSNFTSPISISIYTIEKVYIGDLVQFYNPNTQNHVFYRVINFRVPLNTFDKLPIYELDLEVAPIDSKYDENGNLIATINVNKRYIYDYSTEKYVLYDEFVKKYYIYNFLESQAATFINSKINQKELLVLFNSFTNTFDIIYEFNMWLYKKISSFNKKFSQLVKIKLPFGYKFILPKVIDENTLIDYETLNYQGGKLHKFNALTKTYDEIEIPAINVDFSFIDDGIENKSLNLDSFKSDFEKMIVILYLIDKLATM